MRTAPHPRLRLRLFRRPLPLPPLPRPCAPRRSSPSSARAASANSQTSGATMRTATTRRPAGSFLLSRPWMCPISPHTHSTAPWGALRASLWTASAAPDKSSSDAMPSLKSLRLLASICILLLFKQASEARMPRYHHLNGRCHSHGVYVLEPPLHFSHEQSTCASSLLFCVHVFTLFIVSFSFRIKGAGYCPLLSRACVFHLPAVAPCAFLSPCVTLMSGS